jgi:hypothetical protein
MGNILDKYKALPAIGYEKAYMVLIAVVAVSFISTFFVTETRAQNIYQAIPSKGERSGGKACLTGSESTSSIS